VWRDLGQHRGQVEVARPAGPRAARQYPRSSLYRAANLRLQLVHDGCRGKRPDLHRFIHRITHLQRLEALDEAFDEPVIDGLVHDEPFGGDAGLAVVDGPGSYRRLDRILESGARHYDERIAPAQLEHRLL